MKALVIYWTGTGNTRRVAETIHKTLEMSQVNSVLKSLEKAGEDDLHEYDLVCLGSPSHVWQPPAPVLKYIKEKMDFHRVRGDIKMCSPKLPGKHGLVFVTYSGPHTGINEAIPVGKYLGQFIEHLGFNLAGEIYVVGEFHNREEASTKGKLGDIRGRPNQADLDKVTAEIETLLKTISGSHLHCC